MVRAPFYDKNGLRKGAWSPEEDKKLKTYIERYGHWNWRELPKFAGLERCGKSCRLRWINYLRPNVKRGNFTQDEEEIILKLHAELGNKWSIIAAKLPGRTDNEIKNHWHTHLKKRAMENQARIDGKYEVKEQCAGHSSDHKSGHSKDLKSDNIRDDAFSHPILESSPLSPEASSSDMSYSLSHELAQLSDTNQMRDDMVMRETFQDMCVDFWTEPFISESDHAYLQNNIQFPFEAEQFDLTSASFYDNREDLMYQAMQELPEN